jgi:hypothetical protein
MIMAGKYAGLKPKPGARLSAAPWYAADDGTIIAANGKAVCVLGVPDDDMSEQDITNGAAILALPKMLRALELIHDENPKISTAAWIAVCEALAAAKAGHEVQRR